MAVLYSINPATYEKIGSVKVSSKNEIIQKVKLANEAKLLWKELGVIKRTRMLKPLYSEFIRKRTDIASIVTKEIGKPITESLDDLEWDKQYFKEFLNNGKKYLKDEITFKGGGETHKIVLNRLE